MKETPGNSYLTGRLRPEEFRIAREENLAELNRHSTSRIFTVEQTRQHPDALEISYGDFSQALLVEAKGKVRPGTKILVVQQSEEVLSPIKGVYILGENLLEIPIQNQSQPEPPQ